MEATGLDLKDPFILEFREFCSWRPGPPAAKWIELQAGAIFQSQEGEQPPLGPGGWHRAGAQLAIVPAIHEINIVD